MEVFWGLIKQVDKRKGCRKIKKYREKGLRKEKMKKGELWKDR